MKLILASLAACATFALPITAGATVRYDFATLSPFDGYIDQRYRDISASFSVVTNDYIQINPMAYSVSPPAGSCTISTSNAAASCGSLLFNQDLIWNGSATFFDQIQVMLFGDNGLQILRANFEQDAFKRPGTYFTDNTVFGATARLTVTDLSAPAVPEPATWALMLIGFGAVGLSLRRRKQPLRTNVVFG